MSQQQQNQQSKGPDAVARATSLLGFDPVRPAKITKSVLQEAQEEIRAEKAAAAKKLAKEKLLALEKEIAAFKAKEADFEKTRAAFYKTVGKAMGELEAIAGGGEAPADETAEQVEAPKPVQ